VFTAHDAPGAPSTVGRISYTPPLLSCLDDLLVRIETLLPLEMLPVTAGLRRPTVRTVPMTVAREMLANAIAHRDWRLPQPISVSITAGSIVDVVSPGGFPFGVTAANVLAHPSKPTNPALAHALQVLQVAERQGVGVDLMFRAARRYRCSRAPTFIRGPNRPDCHLHRSQ
jgi:ATP-dependent DNA helicase RecG